MYRIFIAENMPSLNKGEMTILEGMMETFKNLDEVEVSMLSAVTDVDKCRYGTMVEMIDVGKYLPLSLDFSIGNICNWLIRLFSSIIFLAKHMPFLILHKTFGLKTLKFMKSEIWGNYVKSDIIIVGHDNSFNLGGGWGTPILFYPLFIPLFAKMLGKPVAFYGGTFQPPLISHWFLKRAYMFTLGKMDLITLRERISYQNLTTLGFRSNKMFVTADPAFLLQPVSSEDARKIMRQENIDVYQKPLIGITVTREKASISFPELRNSQSSYYTHIKMLAEVIDKLIDELGARVVFVPHCIGYGERLDDRIVSNEVYQRCQNKHGVKVITTEYNAAELKGLIGQFDFFIGERLHSVINAMSVGVPSIVISNAADQRLDIIRMLGQDEAICYIENLDRDTLLAKVNDAWSRRDSIREELKSQVEIMQERAKLNGKLLKELLDSQEREKWD
jgi:polysaccharide pyruvyl transferase WcaK-like protein